eukprot:2050293-Prymnesium_polylepis.1
MLPASAMHSAFWKVRVPSSWYTYSMTARVNVVFSFPYKLFPHARRMTLGSTGTTLRELLTMETPVSAAEKTG